MKVQERSYISEALKLLGPFNRDGCSLTEAGAERAIRDLIERHVECEAHAKLPTPAQMRKAVGAFDKLGRHWENARQLSGGEHALRAVLAMPSSSIFTLIASAIGAEHPAQGFELLMNVFATAVRETSAAAADWKGKGWIGKSTPVSFSTINTDPNLVLIRWCSALLAVCGKPHKISRKNGRLIRLARLVWKEASPSSEHEAPHFRNQIDKLNRFRLHSARKGPRDRAQAKRELEGHLKTYIDRLIRTYS